MSVVEKTGMSKGNERNQKLFSFVFILEILLFFLLSFFFVPQSDDMSFRYIQEYSSLGEFMHRVFYYGNGRILGNLFELFFSRHTQIFYFIESILVALFAVSVEKVTGLKNSRIIVMAAIMLQNVILFRDSISWMAGFINYYFPIILFILTLLIIKKLDGKLNKLHQIFFLFVLIVFGFCEQLFAEHNTVINLLITLCMVLVAFKSKKRGATAPLLLLVSNIAGAAVEFLYGFFIDQEQTYVAQSFPQGYRSTLFSQPSIKDAIFIVGKNMKTPPLVISASIFIFAALFSVMFYIIKRTADNPKTKRNLIICCVMYSLLAVLSTYILIKYCNDFPLENKKALALLVVFFFLFVLTFLEMGILVYKIVLKQASNDYKIKICSSVFFGILSVCPFFVVFPCGYRCCVFLYFFFTLALIYIIKFAQEKYGLNTNIICAVSAIFTCAVLLIYTLIFAREKKIFNLQKEYYMESVYLPNSNDYFILPELWDKVSGFEHEYIPLDEFEKVSEWY